MWLRINDVVYSYKLSPVSGTSIRHQYQAPDKAGDPVKASKNTQHHLYVAKGFFSFSSGTHAAMLRTFAFDNIT